MKYNRYNFDEIIGEYCLYSLTDSISLDKLNLYIKSIDPYAKAVEADFEKASKSKSVQFNKINEDIGYCKISYFINGTHDEFMDGCSKGDKLILDLRDNTGGVLEEAILIAKVLVDEVKYNLVNKKSCQTINIDGKRLFKNIVCLVNSNTMSSSEFIVGLLKEAKNSIIIGETNTYGKNTIQQHISLEGLEIYVTTGKFIHLKLGDIESIGIIPDYFCKRYDININESYFGKLSSRIEMKINDFSSNVFALQQRISFLNNNFLIINGKCCCDTIKAAKKIVYDNENENKNDNDTANKDIISIEAIKKIDKLFFEKINSFEYDKQLKEAIDLLSTK